MNAGDPCPECKAYLNVYATLIIEGTRKRYIKCRHCGFIPQENVQTISLAEAPRQPQKHWQKNRTTVVTGIRQA